MEKSLIGSPRREIQKAIGRARCFSIFKDENWNFDWKDWTNFEPWRDEVRFWTAFAHNTSSIFERDCSLFEVDRSDSSPQSSLISLSESDFIDKKNRFLLESFFFEFSYFIWSKCMKPYVFLFRQNM